MIRTQYLGLIGAELRRRRRDRGLTQADLARRTHLSRSLVVRAERGDPTIAVGNIERLLGATGGALAAVTLRRPTLDEATVLFSDD